MKKKGLLIYHEANRNAELKNVSQLLSSILNKFGIDCDIETCSQFNSAEKLKDDVYDIVAGYHIDVQNELALSEAFKGRYLHFFDGVYAFNFATVTKKEELGGYLMYNISSVSPAVN